MCLGIPMMVEEMKGESALVSAGGLKREINISLVRGLKRGDYVIVHAGFAIEKVDRKRADETLKIIEDMSRLV